jgi:hypothetical protein
LIFDRAIGLLLVRKFRHGAIEPIDVSNPQKNSLSSSELIQATAPTDKAIAAIRSLVEKERRF